MSRRHRAPMIELLTEMVLGELAPGHQLPREVDLAERFRMSRGTARECVRALEERGFVVVKHGRGATVTPREWWNVLDPDVYEVLMATPDRDRVEHNAIACQRVLEVEAVGLAAEHASPEDIGSLTTALDRMADAIPRLQQSPTAARRYHEADFDFHRTLVRASGNESLAQLSAPLHRALIAAVRERPSVSDAKRRLAEHREIVGAIHARDPSAARAAMTKHLTTG